MHCHLNDLCVIVYCCLSQSLSVSMYNVALVHELFYGQSLFGHNRYDL